MLILLSPSKTLDFESPFTIPAGGVPEMIGQSKKLVSLLRRLKPDDLAKLMNISPKLAELNALRYSEWHYPFPEGKARPAIAAFKGDVYDGLKAWELNPEQIGFADQHLRILSGLYGILKPTDLMLAYRLEMGSKLTGKDFTNLYQFWGNSITKSVKNATDNSGSPLLINLASAEYAKVVDFKVTKARVITPVFKEFSNGNLRFISFNGKRARGLMARFIIDRKIANPEELKLFDYEGYGYMDQLSGKDEWVYVR
ncbi:MAG: peroxide stress protein YaaA [Lentimicrobium sp.]|nr:peroxide stress protein YaaA [Lentimicrobium sp.]